jgi:hypothetical protein
MSTYQDPVCSQISVGYIMNSLGPGCGDIPGPLLGKQVTDIHYQSGSCEPLGGEPVGSAELLGPTTFCCQE